MSSSTTDACVIRKAKEEDCSGIMSLIQKLAAFVKHPNAVNITTETLRRDGFGSEKMFHCFVTEDTVNRKLVGLALYFYNYSSWRGVSVYLEDLYVLPEYRHKGLGTQMWKEVAKVAVERGCSRLDWLCLDWNKPAQGFYFSKGANNLTTKEGWNLFRLDGDNLKTFATE